MKTLLYVEDNANDRLLFASACRIARVSFRLKIVEGGIEAIDYFAGEGSFANRAEHPIPDLLFLDLKMPEMDGFQVLRWIRGHPPSRTLPVAVYSASPLSGDVATAYAEGAQFFIVKPTPFTSLLDIVRAADECLAAEPMKSEALARFSAPAEQLSRCFSVSPDMS
ncbi:MAG: response regulator [Verrucomicrobia bacterium]|nr:response regulator [Verrucomicrobiota bacterium]